MLKKAYNWLVKSSADPSKLALTVRGFAPFLLLLGVEQQMIDEGTNALVALVVGAGMFASAAVGFYGLGRKVWNTVRA